LKVQILHSVESVLERTVAQKGLDDGSHLMDDGLSLCGHDSSKLREWSPDGSRRPTLDIR